MSKDKDTIKQVAIAVMKPITLAARKIDQLQGAIDAKVGAKFAAQKALANEVLKHKGKGKKLVIKTEYARLLTYAKGIVAADGLVLHHEKNLWSAVGNLILRDLAKDKVIKADAGRDAKGNKVTGRVKVSELPKTAKQVATTASAIRAVVGMGDNRSTNAPKTRKPRPPESAPQTHSTATTAKNWSESFTFAFKTVKASRQLVQAIYDHRKKIIDTAAAMGYVVTITSK